MCTSSNRVWAIWSIKFAVLFICLQMPNTTSAHPSWLDQSTKIVAREETSQIDYPAPSKQIKSNGCFCFSLNDVAPCCPFCASGFGSSLHHVGLLELSELALLNLKERLCTRFLVVGSYSFTLDIWTKQTRKGWCPRTERGQRLMGILAVTGYGSV